MTKPTICRDVVYHMRHINHDGVHGEILDRPAKVVFVYEDGATVDLTVFGRGEAELPAMALAKVEHDQTGKKSGTWRWPDGSPAALDRKPEEAR